jgi:hypothetical protein
MPREGPAQPPSKIITRMGWLSSRFFMKSLIISFAFAVTVNMLSVLSDTGVSFAWRFPHIPGDAPMQ